MLLSDNDRSVMEQALTEAINHSGSYQSKIHYRQLLTKLQNVPHRNAAESAETPYQDGFRYDYDDSAGLI
ncbi:hypothetical protein [Paenibacillus gansuensis]|uniref:Uncharacterized protein n=1 Tax=Paenibacillus gansuensis TaxID=306542 RepID=A0ABW5PA28_9BACL